ncbi:hypothetical protein V8C26DRAFT_175750 [Trichoderma gracile]
MSQNWRRGRISSPRTNRKQASHTDHSPHSPPPYPALLLRHLEQTRAADNDTDDRGKTVKEPWDDSTSHRVQVHTIPIDVRTPLHCTHTHKDTSSECEPHRQHHQQRHSNPAIHFSQPSVDTALPNGRNILVRKSGKRTNSYPIHHSETSPTNLSTLAGSFFFMPNRTEQLSNFYQENPQTHGCIKTEATAVRGSMSMHDLNNASSRKPTCVRTPATAGDNKETKDFKKEKGKKRKHKNRCVKKAILPMGKVLQACMRVLQRVPRNPRFRKPSRRLANFLFFFFSPGDGATRGTRANSRYSIHETLHTWMRLIRREARDGTAVVCGFSSRERSLTLLLPCICVTWHNAFVTANGRI